jgi:hypothetical protein
MATVADLVARSEVLKLAVELDVDPQELEFLQRLGGENVHEIRRFSSAICAER